LWKGWYLKELRAIKRRKVLRTGSDRNAVAPSPLRLQCIRASYVTVEAGPRISEQFKAFFYTKIAVQYTMLGSPILCNHPRRSNLTNQPGFKVFVCTKIAVKMPNLEIFCCPTPEEQGVTPDFHALSNTLSHSPIPCSNNTAKTCCCCRNSNQIQVTCTAPRTEVKKPYLRSKPHVWINSSSAREWGPWILAKGRSCRYPASEAE
jgi:hypothetical protein